MVSRGRFIVFEGLDRSGKSTQVQILVDKLNADGRHAVLQKFPDRTTPIGKMIDSYLQSKADMDDRAIHLLFSANRWELAATIEQQLSQGIDVIADRYAFSGIAFSAGKGLPFNFCMQPDTGLPLPDITLYLTVPPEIASSRDAYGSERYETMELQTKVRSEFRNVSKKVRHMHGDVWRDIEAVGSIDEVALQVWHLVSGLKAGAGGKLWEKPGL